MRCEFVLDHRTSRLLDELAFSRSDNRSFVVREAIQLYAALDSILGGIEAGAGFRRMMERSAADIRAGRVKTHVEVKKQLRQVSRKR